MATPKQPKAIQRPKATSSTANPTQRQPAPPAMRPAATTQRRSPTPRRMM